MWFWNTVSGVLFYSATWNYSIRFNAVYNSINFGILTVVVLWISYYTFNFKTLLVEYKAQLNWKRQQQGMTREVMIRVK
ncbi:hypothetical protein [Ureaplasma ceti]